MRGYANGASRFASASAHRLVGGSAICALTCSHVEPSIDIEVAVTDGKIGHVRLILGATVRVAVADSLQNRNDVGQRLREGKVHQLNSDTGEGLAAGSCVRLSWLDH